MDARDNTGGNVSGRIGSADDANQILANYNGWLHKVASQLRNPSDPHYQDLVQEWRIAMWHALETYDPSKGSQPAWLTACAHYRMIEIVSGKKYTGQPARLHQHTRAEEPPTLSLDTPLNSDGGSLTLGDTVPDPSNPLERAGMAYHRAEIAAARRRLTPAQQLYVAARFYDQLTEREIRNSALFNRDPKLLWRDPKYGARAKLANELGHLRDSL